jgi:hypothetical protein
VIRVTSFARPISITESVLSRRLLT